MGRGQNEEREALLEGARSLGVELGQGELGRLLRYADLVREWNQRINLVSRKDIGNLVSGHIVDSLAGVPVLKKLLVGVAAGQAASLDRRAGGLSQDDTAPAHPPRVMDLGSGGGLPGIPLKIVMPEVEMTLVESTKKKARFLETAIRELELEGVTVVGLHSKEIGNNPDHRGKYDAVVARAVAEMKDLVGLAFLFLKPEGWLVAYKGAKAVEEMIAAKGILQRLGGIIEERPEKALPDTGKARHIVMVRKAGRSR